MSIPNLVRIVKLHMDTKRKQNETAARTKEQTSFALFMEKHIATYLSNADLVK